MAAWRSSRRKTWGKAKGKAKGLSPQPGQAVIKLRHIARDAERESPEWSPGALAPGKILQGARARAGAAMKFYSEPEPSKSTALASKEVRAYAGESQ